jgi:RNA polymerase-binding transcription factor DksA
MKTHSTSFIKEMKALIEEEKAKLEADLGQSAHRQEGNYVADFPVYGQDEEDNATEIADYTATSAVTEAKEARLRELQAALKRIEEGTYGRTDSGEYIPEKRLRANPAATTLVTG